MCYQCPGPVPFGSCEGKSAYNVVECDQGVTACLNYTVKDPASGSTNMYRLDCATSSFLKDNSNLLDAQPGKCLPHRHVFFATPGF